MPRRSRNRAYGKRQAFSQTPRAPARARARAYTQRRAAPEEDIKITVGRARVWIYNNTNDTLFIRPGEYVELVIDREYDNNMGLNIRARLAEPVENSHGSDVRFERREWV